MNLFWGLLLGDYLHTGSRQNEIVAKRINFSDKNKILATISLCLLPAKNYYPKELMSPKNKYSDFFIFHTNYICWGETLKTVTEATCKEKASTHDLYLSLFNRLQIYYPAIFFGDFFIPLVLTWSSCQNILTKKLPCRRSLFFWLLLG